MAMNLKIEGEVDAIRQLVFRIVDAECERLSAVDDGSGIGQIIAQVGRLGIRRRRGARRPPRSRQVVLRVVDLAGQPVPATNGNVVEVEVGRVSAVIRGAVRAVLLGNEGFCLH